MKNINEIKEELMCSIKHLAIAITAIDEIFNPGSSTITKPVEKKVVAKEHKKKRNGYFHGGSRCNDVIREKALIALTELQSRISLAKISQKIGLVGSNTIYRVLRSGRMSGRVAQGILDLHKEIFG
jgi:hypothetical protein